MLSNDVRTPCSPEECAVELKDYRARESECRRTEDLLRLLPGGGGEALDVGAREGHFSRLLADRYARVVALDLGKPAFEHPNVDCVQGDASALEFADDSFDLVFCAEVLEHIPTPLLGKACAELGRVSRSHLLIGVPYRQDTRLGRSTCYSCGGKNPPWGHVNSFDEQRLMVLFPGYEVVNTSFVGESDETTNFLAAFLMDLAGNPYGTYTQDEPCVHCGKLLLAPPARSVFQKVCTRLGFYASQATRALKGRHPNWIHMLLRKRER